LVITYSLLNKKNQYLAPLFGWVEPPYNYYGKYYGYFAKITIDFLGTVYGPY
jgi:hypothetical protein